MDSDAEYAAQAEHAKETVNEIVMNYMSWRGHIDEPSSFLRPLVELVLMGNDWEKEEAARWICICHQIDADAHQHIMSAGAIAALVEMLRTVATNQQKEAAITALNFLVKDSDGVCVDVVQAGAVPLLIKALLNVPSGVRCGAASTLAAMVQHGNARAAIQKAGVLQPIMVHLRSDDSASNETAVWLLASLTRFCPEVGHEAVQAGALEMLVPLLHNGQGLVKERAATVIQNLVLDIDKDAAVAAGALGPLLKMSQAGSSDEKLAAIVALGSLAANEGGEKRIVVVGAGTVRSILQFIRYSDHKCVMACTLGNFAYSCKANRDTLMKASVVGPLVRLLGTGSEREKEVAVMALGNLAIGCTENQDVVFASGVIPFAVELLGSADDRTARTAANALNSLMKKSRAAQFAVAQAGAIPLLVKLATSGTDTQRVAAVRALRKLVDGNRFHQSTVGEAGIIHVLSDAIHQPEPTAELKILAVRAVGKLAESHANNQARIVNTGVVGKLATDWTTADAKMKGSIATALRYIAQDEIAYAILESLGVTHIINEQRQSPTINKDEFKNAD